jgi:hypothetical protein
MPRMITGQHRIKDVASLKAMCPRTMREIEDLIVHCAEDSMVEDCLDDLGSLLIQLIGEAYPSIRRNETTTQDDWPRV